MAVLANRVRMNVTGTPGTGTITLGTSYSASFLSFNEAGVPDGAKVSYAIDDGNDFEIGYGTYGLAGTTLTRDTVLVSKIGGVSGTTKLNLTSAAQVRIAYVQQSIRTRLIADIVYYVATTGNNSNNGLAASTPWLTLQFAWDYICDNLDLNGFTVTIQVADGTYTAGINTYRGVTSAKGSSNVVIQGNNGTPANVLISTTSADAFAFGPTPAELGAQVAVRIRDMKIQTTTSGDCITVMGGGAYVQFDGINFGACAQYHIVASAGAYVYESGAVNGPGTSNYSISGGALAHVQAAEGGQVTLHSATATLSGTPNFSIAFAYALWGGRTFLNGMTFAGTGATGKRFQSDDKGLVYTGAGRTYLPGDTEGTCSGGGEYIGSEILIGLWSPQSQNIIINGGIEVSQENDATLVSSAANGSYPVDMVKYTFLGTMSVNTQQVTDAPTGYRNSVKVTVNTGETLGGTNPGNYSLLVFPIEGTRVAKLCWGTTSAQSVAIAFWSKIHRTGTYSVCLLNAAGNRSYAFNFTQNVADTWQLNTVVVPGDTTGAWVTSSALSLQLIFPIGVGNTFQGAANTWSASAIFGATGTTNSVAATTDVYQITGVCMLPGSELPSPNQIPNTIRPYQDELNLSRRYFWRRNFSNVQYITNLQALSSTLAVGKVFDFAEMRAAPTITDSADANFSNQSGAGTSTPYVSITWSSYVDSLTVSNSSTANMTLATPTNFLANTTAWIQGSARI